MNVRPAEQVLRSCFRIADKDSNGIISKNEYIGELKGIFENYTFDKRGMHSRLAYTWSNTLNITVFIHIKWQFWEYWVLVCFFVFPCSLCRSSLWLLLRWIRCQFETRRCFGRRTCWNSSESSSIMPPIFELVRGDKTNSSSSLLKKKIYRINQRQLRSIRWMVRSCQRWELFRMKVLNRAFSPNNKIIIMS